MKRKWTKKEAKKYIHMVNRMMILYGLTFCSACDFLGISVNTTKAYKDMREAQERRRRSGFGNY